MNWKIALAVWQFHSRRVTYYEYLAQYLTHTRGQIVFKDIFWADTKKDRFGGEPRGILSAEWAERYESNGANLALTFEGTLPASEVSVLRMAAGSDGDGLIQAFKDIARLAKTSDNIRKEIISVMTVAFVSMGIALLMLTVFPIFALQEVRGQFSFLPVESWRPSGIQVLNYVEGVKAHGVFYFIAFVLMIYAIVWSMNNVIGSLREWLDRRIFFYKTFRDLKASLFLAQMASLTKKRGNITSTLEPALAMLRDTTSSRWERWRYQQVIDNISDIGADSAESFNTPFIPRETFQFFRDISATSDISTGFTSAVDYVDSTLVKELTVKLQFYRWLLLGVSVLIAFTVMSMTTGVIQDMIEATKSFYS